jgi:hypothetical protein
VILPDSSGFRILQDSGFFRIQDSSGFRILQDSGFFRIQDSSGFIKTTDPADLKISVGLNH